MEYFSDRESGPKPRTDEEISQGAWGGIISAVESRISDGAFGLKFPVECPDGKGIYGCDRALFFMSLRSEVPDFEALDSREVPPTLVVLDLLEFCHRVVAEPIKRDFHDYFSHHHLQFDQDKGRTSFRDDINRIFARNGIAYELSQDGLIKRLLPEELQETLGGAKFLTGDKELDGLLETARKKYFDPDLDVRREALEKLWDAWERLKTIEPGKDKKESATVLLDICATEVKFRETIETEARELTRIGNTFRIRHSETTQVSLEQSEHVDYLFHRLFALIHMLLQIRSNQEGQE